MADIREALALKELASSLKSGATILIVQPETVNGQIIPAIRRMTPSMLQGGFNTDAEPTQDSANLISSGAVYESEKEIRDFLDGLGLSVVDGVLHISYEE